MFLKKLTQRWQQRPDIRRRKLKRFQARHGTKRLRSREISPASIAIIIPVFRHEQHIGTCLHSVFAQTRRPDEIILINDASPDASLDVIDKIISEWPPTLNACARVISNPRNIGQSASINEAVSLARSDLMMILNDDDALLPHAVEITMTLFAQNPGIHLSGAHAEHFSSDAEYEALANKSWPQVGPDDVDIRNPAMTPKYLYGNDLNMTHTASCFTLQAWRACGGYYPRKQDRVIRFSDRDFQLRVASVAQVALLPRYPLSLWRNNSSVDAGIDS